MSNTDLPPECQARFRLVRPIARGGFGAVYEAVQLSLGRRVAIKVLGRRAFLHHESVLRFLKEAQGTAALSHPNIVRIYDHGAEGGLPWIAYEYVGGGTLTAQVAAGRLPWDDALRAAIQVVMALAEAHGRGILHRDVKSANVLRAEGDVYKLTDFGIARWAPGVSVAAEPSPIGTPSYMAPETLTGGTCPASDLYALGVMLFEMTAGQLPYRASGIFQLVAMHEGAPIPSVRALVAEVPAGVDALIARAMAKRPVDRFASAAEMASAMLALLPGGRLSKELRQVPAAAPTPAPAAVPVAKRCGPNEVRRPRLPRRLAAAGFTALALGLVAMAAWWRSAPAVLRPPVVVATQEPPARLPRLQAVLARLNAERTTGCISYVALAILVTKGSPETLLRSREHLACNRAARHFAGDALDECAAEVAAPQSCSDPLLLLALEELAAAYAVAYFDEKRAEQLLERLEKRSAGSKMVGAELGWGLGVVEHLRVHRSVLVPVRRHRGVAAAALLRFAARPTSQGKELAEVLTRLTRVARRFTHTAIESVPVADIDEEGAGDLRRRLAGARGERGGRLDLVVPALWSIGVRGRGPASRELCAAIEPDLVALKQEFPALGPVFGDMQARLLPARAAR